MGSGAVVSATGGGVIGALGGLFLGGGVLTWWFKSQPLPPDDVRQRILSYTVWIIVLSAVTSACNGLLLHLLFIRQDRATAPAMFTATVGLIAGIVLGAILGFALTMILLLILRANGQAILGAMAMAMLSVLVNGPAGIVAGLVIPRLHRP